MRRRVAARSLLAAVAILVPFAPAVAAAGPPNAPPPVPPLSGSVGAQANAVAAPGDRIQHSTARSRDVTDDGWPDIVARQPNINNGALWVYTHSHVVGGSMFATKTLVGTGWNVHNWVGVAEVTGDTPEFETATEEPADLIARRASDGALMVYPHSGQFNGTSTWLAPIIVGAGWNIFEGMTVADVNTDGFDDILAWDNDGQKVYLYLHSGTFRGVGTFLPGRLMWEGGARPGEWDILTDWSREHPDLVGFFLQDNGQVSAARHSGKVNGAGTWENTPEGLWQVSTGVFTQATTFCLFLIDVNGDGTDDIVKSTQTGALMYYPFNGWRSSPALGAPMQIGSGWQVMDLIT